MSSDWPFMVSKDSAADYARYRAHLHAHATREIAGALASGRREQAERLAAGLEPRRRPVRATVWTPRNGCPTLVKVLMVSWEYPPVVVGGLGRHVYQLATALAAAGHEVVVLSRRPIEHRPEHASVDRRDRRGRTGSGRGAGPARVRLRLGHDGLDAGDGSLDDARRPGTEEPRQAARGRGAPTSCTRTTGWSRTRRSRLAEFFDVPLVSTIHATEAGRHSGWVSGPISRQVHAVESWLVRESDSLITCSASMSDEITELFGPGLAEIRVIRNGIDAALWPFATRRPRKGPAQLLYLGRLGVREGHPRRDRGAAPHQAHPPGHDADDRGRRHAVRVARRAGPKAQGAQGRNVRRPGRPPGPRAACCTPPTPPCCPATTSRSASSRWKRRRPAPRW